MKRLRMWLRLIWIDLTEAPRKMFRPMVTWHMSATLIRRGIEDPMEVVRLLRMGTPPSEVLDLATPPRFMTWEDAICILDQWPEIREIEGRKRVDGCDAI